MEPELGSRANTLFLANRMLTQFVPHYHAIIEGPLRPSDDGSLQRLRADLRLFAESHEDAMEKAMAGIEESCQHLDMPFDPDEWTLLNIHTHGTN